MACSPAGADRSGVDHTRRAEIPAADCLLRQAEWPAPATACTLARAPHGPETRQPVPPAGGLGRCAAQIGRHAAAVATAWTQVSSKSALRLEQADQPGNPQNIQPASCRPPLDPHAGKAALHVG